MDVDLFQALISVLLALISFIGMSIIYFLKLSFAKLEVLSLEINDLKIELEKIKRI
jgi:hypothetical protein